jgi:hypothetical protein
MRKSKAVTLSLLGLGTAGLAGGCGGSSSESAQAPEVTPSTDSDPSEVAFEPDDTWYDPQGNPIPEEWTTDPTGKEVPVRHPHDALGRPWVYDSEGNLVPPPRTTVRTTQLFGPFVFIHSAHGGRPGGTVAPRSTPRGGFGTIGGRIGPGAT